MKNLTLSHYHFSKRKPQQYTNVYCQNPTRNSKATSVDAKDILEKVSNDRDDIFEKVSDYAKDILEKVSDDGDDIF